MPTNQSTSTIDSSNAAAAASDGVTSPPQSPHGGRRKKMLSFEPNADFFVVDSSAETITPQTTSGGGNRVRQRSHEKNRRRQNSAESLMGPILPRKKVLSMPLCSPSSDYFFQGAATSSAPIMEESIAEDGTVVSSSSQMQQQAAAAAAAAASAQRSLARHAHRMRQNTAPAGSGREFFHADDVPHDEAHPSARRTRKKTNSFMAGVLARRAVAMDLLPADDADLGVYEFFSAHAAPVGLEHYGEETKEKEEEDLETGATGEEGGAAELIPQDGEVPAGKQKKKLFKPLIFAPRKMMPGAGGGHGHPHGGGGAFCDIVASTQQMQDSKEPTTITLGTDEDKDGTDVLDASEAIPLTTAGDESSEKKKSDEFIDNGDDVDEDRQDETISSQKHYDDSHIIRATKKDYVFTAFLVVVMSALVGVVVGWPTHLDESDNIYGPVGLACKTVSRELSCCFLFISIISMYINLHSLLPFLQPCRGDVYDQDYFRGRNQFNSGDVIFLTPHIDTTLTEESYLRMAIRGVQSNKTKWVSSDDVFGPASVEGKRVTKEARVTVNWEIPGEQHVIDVWSTVSCCILPSLAVHPLLMKSC